MQFWSHQGMQTRVLQTPSQGCRPKLTQTQSCRGVQTRGNADPRWGRSATTHQDPHIIPWPPCYSINDIQLLMIYRVNLIPLASNSCASYAQTSYPPLQQSTNWRNSFTTYLVNMRTTNQKGMEIMCCTTNFCPDIHNKFGSIFSHLNSSLNPSCADTK